MLGAPDEERLQPVRPLAQDDGDRCARGDRFGDVHRRPRAERRADRVPVHIFIVWFHSNEGCRRRPRSQGRVSRIGLVLSAAFCVVGTAGAVGSWAVYRMDGTIARDGERADGHVTRKTFVCAADGDSDYTIDYWFASAERRARRGDARDRQGVLAGAARGGHARGAVLRREPEAQLPGAERASRPRRDRLRLARLRDARRLRSPGVQRARPTAERAELTSAPGS